MVVADSRGSQALSKCGRSHGQIARRCGVSRPLVTQWCSGKKNPNDECKAILETDFQVGFAWWGEPVSGAPGPVLVSPVAPLAPPPPAFVVQPPAYLAPSPPRTPLPPARPVDKDDGKGALEHARDHVRAIQKSLLDRPLDLDLRKALTQAIGQLRQAERDEEARTARILKSAEWKRIEEAIVSALKPFGSKPLQAVGEALARLDADEDDVLEERAA